MDAAPRILRLLFAWDPFAGTPPRHVRIELYRYQLAKPGATVWWERTRVAPWLPRLTRDDGELRESWDGRGGATRSERPCRSLLVRSALLGQTVSNDAKSALCERQPRVIVGAAEKT
ncbi:MAG TPA: hypothetical protein VGK52_18950 [Polyangia bacterium]|jgi:hypothetical protein